MLAPTSESLKKWASSNPQAIERVLKLASLARTNDFDLINEEGWCMLREEICNDFPKLTLADLSHIIKRGIKGKIDTNYKSTALNFTQIYQWVEAEAELLIKQRPNEPLTDEEKKQQIAAMRARNANLPTR